MTNQPKLIILALSLAMLVTPAAAVARAPVLESLNAQRAAHGLPAGISENADWSAGCNAHVNYMKVNSYFGHDEDPAKPGYTQAGYNAGHSSVLASAGWPSVEDNPFEFAPIHLAQLMAPALSVTGFDDNGICVHTWPGYQRTLPATISFYSYPGPGTSNWRYQESTYESPFTPAEVLGLANPTGPHIYLYPFGVGYYSLQAKTITLTGPDGVVDSRFVASGDGSKVAPYLPGGAILIPVKPLQPLSRYTVSSQWQSKAPSAVFTEDERLLDVKRIWGLFTLSEVDQASELAKYNSKTSSERYWYWSDLITVCEKAAAGTRAGRPFNKTLPADSLCRTVKALSDERSFTTEPAPQPDGGDTSDDNGDSQEVTAASFLARGKGRLVIIKIAANPAFRGQQAKLTLVFTRGRKTKKIKRLVTLTDTQRLRQRSPFASGRVRLLITGSVEANDLYPSQQLSYRYSWRVR